MSGGRRLERTIKHWQSVTPEFLGLLPKASPKRRRATRLGCTLHARSKASAERLSQRLRRAGCAVSIFQSRDKKSWYVLSFERRYRKLTVESVNAWIHRMASTAAKANATFRGWSFHRRHAA